MNTPRILLADDAATVTHLVSAALGALGWGVTCVDNGVDAYQEGKSGEYDLVLLDHFMPDMLGTEVFERWRREGVTVPVIFLSALDDEETVVELLERGVADFLHKPFNPRELIARVRIQLALRARANA